MGSGNGSMAFMFNLIFGHYVGVEVDETEAHISAMMLETHDDVKATIVLANAFRLPPVLQNIAVYYSYLYTMPCEQALLQQMLEMCLRSPSLKLCIFHNRETNCYAQDMDRASALELLFAQLVPADIGEIIDKDYRIKEKYLVESIKEAGLPLQKWSVSGVRDTGVTDYCYGFDVEIFRSLVAENSDANALYNNEEMRALIMKKRGNIYVGECAPCIDASELRLVGIDTTTCKKNTWWVDGGTNRNNTCTPS